VTRTILNLRDQVGDSIRISFTDNSGNILRLVQVFYTVYRSNGDLVSGIRMPAIYRDAGYFYAPWYPFLAGSYRVLWEYADDCQDGYCKKDTFIVAMDPSSGRCLPERNYIVPESSPTFPIYFTPLEFTPFSFPIYFRDTSGTPVDPFSVQYSILDSCGREVIPTVTASQNSVGHYYASFASISSGDYTLRWRFMMVDGDVVQSKDYSFTIVNLCSPPWRYIPGTGQVLMPAECPPSVDSCGCASACSGGEFNYGMCGTACYKPCGC